MINLKIKNLKKKSNVLHKNASANQVKIGTKMSILLACSTTLCVGKFPTRLLFQTFLDTFLNRFKKFHHWNFRLKKIMNFLTDFFSPASHFCSMEEMTRHELRRDPTTFLYATESRLRSSFVNSKHLSKKCNKKLHCTDSGFGDESHKLGHVVVTLRLFGQFRPRNVFCLLIFRTHIL